MEKTYFDLFDDLLINTYLSVKLGNKFVHYIIPYQRKDGTIRTYGDLYKYFTQKEGFRMAMGYMLEVDETGKFWAGQNQYMYFDKNTAPHISERKLGYPLLLPK